MSLPRRKKGAPQTATAKWSSRFSGWRYVQAESAPEGSRRSALPDGMKPLARRRTRSRSSSAQTQPRLPERLQPEPESAPNSIPAANLCPDASHGHSNCALIFGLAAGRSQEAQPVCPSRRWPSQRAGILLATYPQPTIYPGIYCDMNHHSGTNPPFAPLRCFRPTWR